MSEGDSDKWTRRIAVAGLSISLIISVYTGVDGTLRLALAGTLGFVIGKHL